MPIVNLKESAQEKPKEVIRIESPEAKSIVVDTRYTPSNDIISFIEGSPWVVDKYYSQVLNKDSATAGQNLGMTAINQQYRSIEKMELRVTSALQPNQDVEHKVMSVVGTASVFPCLIPNEGDMFLADVGDGRQGIFQVTNSERKSIFKDTSHVIEYQLIAYSDMENGRLVDLESKVVDKFVFVRDYMNYNQNPIIAVKEFDRIQVLKKLYMEITKNYFKYFFSNEFQTLLVPGQEKSIYDHFLTRACKAIFSSTDAPELMKVRVLNVGDDYLMETNQFWDVLIKNDYRMLNYTANRYGLASARVFHDAPKMNGIRYSGIDYVVYPKEFVSDVDSERRYKKTLSPEVIKSVPPRTNLPPFTPTPLEGTGYNFNFDMIPPYEDAKDGTIDGVANPIPGFTPGYVSPLSDSNTIVDEYYDFAKAGSEYVGDPLDIGMYNDILDGISDVVFDAPDIHLVTKDDYYVFSEAFYKFNNGLQGPGMSRMEIMVCRMIRQMSLDSDTLIRLCMSYHYWGAVERFYYLPVLLVLVRYSLKF